MIGGAITVLGWARWRGWLGPQTLDMAAVPLAVGNAIGRVGCQLAGDGDYGKAWDGPWAMGYPNGTVPTDPGETVHPTPIYESVAMGLIAWLLWSLRDRVRPGCLFALWLLLAGLERLLVEFVRRNDAVVLGLTLPQLQSLVMIAGGLAWLLIVRVATARCCCRQARARGRAASPRLAPRPPRAGLGDEAHAEILELGVVLDRAMVAARDLDEAAARRARRERA